MYDAELSERRGARQVQGRVDRDKPIKPRIGKERHAIEVCTYL